MKKRYDIATVAALMLMACVTTFVFTYLYMMNDLRTQFAEANELRNEFQLYIDVRDRIRSDFVGDWDDDWKLDGAVGGMVESLGDPWSRFLTAAEYSAYFNQGELALWLGLDVRPDPDHHGVIVLSPGTFSF